jgi:hypothetical protein
MLETGEVECSTCYVVASSGFRGRIPTERKIGNWRADMTVLTSTTKGVLLSGAQFTDPIIVPFDVVISNVGTSNGGIGVLGVGSPWAIQVSGSIAGSPSNSAIELDAGGSVTNSTGATISGASNGAFITGGAGTVDNSGSIIAFGTGTLGAAVNLAVGGAVTNQSNAGIQGALFGIFAQGGSAIISNAGTVIGTTSASVEILAGGSVSNLTTGVISGGINGVFVTGASGTIDNSSTISGASGSGIFLGAGGTITNHLGGGITGGAQGLLVNAIPAIVINSGSITGTAGPGINLSSGGTVTNNATGAISGTQFGVFAQNVSATVQNNGAISGLSGIGIELLAGGTVTNLASGSLTGLNAGVFVSGAAGTVTNAGLINATLAGNSFGVQLQTGGTITNFAGGSISSNRTAITAFNAPATVVNSGTISGNVNFGVFLNAGGTVTNSGLIKGANGTAVSFGAGSSRLILNPTSILQGKASAAGSSNVLELSGTTNGTVSGIGSAYSGFQTVLVDANSQWHLAGASTLTTLINNSTIILNSGATLNVSGGISSDLGASGVIDLNGTSTAVLNGSVSSNEVVDLSNANGRLVLGGPGGFAATIRGLSSNDTVDLSGFLAVSKTFANNTLVLTDAGGAQDTLTIQGAFTSSSFQLSSDGNNGTNITVCFAAGTHIDTPDGEVPVEQLQIGDLVLTAHNGPRAVTWIGQGKVLATRGRRSAATPVIVHKGALADNVPNRDLYVTKAHSLYIDDVLIPVEFLVNHRTILWDDRAQEVAIYHVELDSHDVLIANGAPAESYRDDGNRWLFQNANSGWHLPPQEPYAPVLTGGPVVDAAWRRLLDRAGPRDLPPLTDDPDLHLVIDGTRVDPEYRRGSLYGFRLPCSPRSVVVASRSGVPSQLGIARDPRSLGVALRQVAARQGAKFMLFDATDEGLTAGFHAYEADCHLRWTDGRAELPAAAFARFDKGAEVMMYLGGATQYPDDRASTARAAA